MQTITCYAIKAYVCETNKINVMGLDTSHGAWHCAYSAFMAWRIEIAKAAGLPPLQLMEGFYSEDRNPFSLLEYKYPNGDEIDMFQIRSMKTQLPIKWACLKPSPLHKLLYHSDCDGSINWKDCGKIAGSLEKLMPFIPDENFGGHIQNIRDKTNQFISGLKLANSRKEKLVFR